MDQELVVLASTAGNTMATLLATDSWERVKSSLVSLWARHHPRTATEFEDLIRDAYVRIHTAPEVERAAISTKAAAGLAAAICELLRDSQEPLRGLRDVVDELAGTLPRTSNRADSIEIKATVTGHGTANVVGQGEIHVK